MRARRGVILFTFHILGLVVPVVAQQFTRAEIGVDASLLPGNRFLSVTDAGVGARFTYNFTPSLAVDSEFTPYVTNSSVRLTSFQDGGIATVFLIGPKAGIRRKRYAIFGKARPGLMSFSDAATSSAATSGTLVTARKTHAALDLGVVSEVFTSSRTFLRFDIGALLIRNGDATIFTPPNGIVRTDGSINAPWHITAGMGYRMGGFIKDETRLGRPAQDRFESGGQYSLMTLERSAQTVRDESGIGGWFTWNFAHHVGLDSSFSFFPRQAKFVDFQQGGRMVQVLAGVRSGFRRGRLGFFVKFRPGLQLYTLTVQNQQTQNIAPFANPAFDVGGVVEVYTSRRSVLRFDMGNTIIHYRARSTIGFDGTIFQNAGFTRSTVQLITGFGFRF